MRNIGIRMGDFDVTAHHLNRITLKHPDRAQKCNRMVPDGSGQNSGGHLLLGIVFLTGIPRHWDSITV